MIDFALFESLLKCETVEQLHAQTTLITQQMGFEHFFYGAELNPALTPPYQFIINGYPDDWSQRYCDLNYQTVDPVLKYCLERDIPVLWEYLKVLPPDAQNMMDEAKDFGLANGVSFPLCGVGGAFGIFSVAVDKNTKQTQKDIIYALGGVQLLANYLHDSVNRIILCEESGSIEQKLIAGEQIPLPKNKK